MSVLGNTQLRFDDDQAMLLDVSRSFCAERGGLGAARERLEAPLAHSDELWAEIGSMGWTGIGLPEHLGGSGLGIGAAVPVLESMGKSMMAGPLMSNLLASQLLLRADSEAAATLIEDFAGGAAGAVAELESPDWGSLECDTQIDAEGAVHGKKLMVMDLQSAQYVVVLARREDRLCLAVVEVSALPEEAISPRTLMDTTRRAADLSLDAVPSILVIDGERVEEAVRDYRLLGALFVAAESAGAAAACLDVTVDYLKTRKQFGKLIGSYQALKHPAVEILNAVDSARSFCYHAATLIDEGALNEDAETACRMAKAQATDALKFAGDRAVQFHGGMGFTWDCDAQLFIRRAQWAQQQFGDSQHHRRRLAALLLDA
ncbi:MAG: acyl-CoA dehydrogenase family protein [Congregibacter sp.]